MGREEGGGPISFPPDNWDSRTVEGAARQGEFFTALHLKQARPMTRLAFRPVYSIPFSDWQSRP